MVIIDTSALIRYFTGDIKKGAERVASLFDSSETLLVPDVVLPEIEYILLGKTYKAGREKVLGAFKFIATRSNVIISKEAKEAIKIYESSKLDMADCIVAAHSINHKLTSFDKSLLKTPGIGSYWG